MTPAVGKTPGEVHCYNGICHRVKTLDEMKFLVGTETDAITSFYDTAERDRMNTGTITSSGERFDADSDSHAASSLYPDGTELLIWNPKNRHAAHIRVNDFGPFYKLRTIDVTRGVAEKLDFVKTGVARLKVFVIWVPFAEDARYRRRRTYPAVEGHLGRLDADQLVALKNRLIETAPARNGRDPVLLAQAAAAAIRNALPAFARPGPDATRARMAAAIANTLQRALQASGPPQSVSFTPFSGAGNGGGASGSPLAIAAASRPPSALILARDADVSQAISSIEGQTAPAAGPTILVEFAQRGEPDQASLPAEPIVAVQQPAVVAAIANQPRDATPTATAVATPVAAIRELATLQGWTPNSVLWQQLLLTLGILSIGAVGWRTRNASRTRPLAKARSRSVAATSATVAVRSDPFASLRSGLPLNLADAADAHAHLGPENVLSLPQLPRKPAAETLDALRDIAIAHMEAYTYGAAELAYRELFAARAHQLGATDPSTASAERQLADCLREQGRYCAAEPHYRRALATMIAAVGQTHPAVADILDEFAVSTLRQGHGSQAERLARQSLALRRVGGQQTREYAVTLSIIAEALRAQGQLAYAETEHRQAWALFIANSGQDSLDAAASMTSIGTVLGELGRFAAAEELLNASTRILSTALGSDHPASASGYALLGDLYRRAGALDAAAKMQRHALHIRHLTLGNSHPDTIETQLCLALIATEQYRLDDARTYLGRALDHLNVMERNAFGPQSRVRGLLVALSMQHDTRSPAQLAAE